MAARYPGAIFNHLVFVDSHLRGAREVVAGRRTRQRNSIFIRNLFIELLTRLVKRDPS